MNPKSIKFAFLGSSQMSVSALDELRKNGLTPSLILTSPDKPEGRKLVVKPNIVKSYGLEHNIPVLSPYKLDDATFATLSADQARQFDVFIVASFGRIIPERFLKIPKHGCLNIHPSLLPKYRGPSPLQSAILADDKHTGVTIMLVDKEMDHGPIVAVKNIHMNDWPAYKVFEDNMAREGARLVAEILPAFIGGRITPKEQDHSLATYTKKFLKEDGRVDLASDAYDNFRKIQAFHEWPQAYFIHHKDGRDIRVKITQASFTNGALQIEKVIPEGKSAMTWSDFVSGFGSSGGSAATSL
jgi:methionyl-tRNA formyltransferase